MADEYIYNAEHMQKISSDYSGCVPVVDSMITYISSAQTNLEGNYTGMGSETAALSLSTIKSHLELIKSCLEVLSSYVRATLADVQEMDSNQCTGSSSTGG